MVAKNSSPAKRRVKNPETFRERAQKASQERETPKSHHRARQAVKGVLRPVARPMGRGANKLSGFKLFQWLGKVLRFIGRIVFPRYFRESWREMKLVTWPSRRQSRQLTFAVLIFAIIFGGLVALLDLGLDKAFKQLLLK